MKFVVFLEDNRVDFVFLRVDEIGKVVKSRFLGVESVFLPMWKWEGMVLKAFFNSLVYFAHDD